MFSRLKNILLILFCLMAMPMAALCQTVPAVPTWVADMGGPGGNAISTIMKVDAQNNMYVMGIFSGTVDFDPSSGGVKNLTAVSGSFDGFVAKYNTSGGLVWAESFGGSGTDQPNGLDVDINGNITLTGQFDSQPMDANPGAGVFNLTAVGKDAFIIRLDNSGNFLWAKNISGTGTENGGKIASDALGNLVAVGQFQSTINVDGAGIAVKGTTDGYVVKYDAAGNVLWKFSLGAAGGDNSLIAAVTDKNNNTTISGYITGTVDFDPLGPVFNVSGNNSMFIAQYSPSGILLWVNVILGTVPGFNYNINLALDSQNNIYMDGVFSSSINFGSATPLTPKGTQDVFVAKYNQNGVRQFYKGIGGTGSFITNYGIVVSPDDNLYISGYFNGTIDFDPSTAVANVKDHGLRDMFLAKYDINGNYKWAFGEGNSSCNNNLARNVAVDANNDVLLTGSFCSTVNFDASECTSATSTAQGVRDLFIAKYTAVTLIDNNVITPPLKTAFCTATADPDLITGGTPTGGIGAYKYQWQISDSALGFVDIAGATNKDYNPVPINASTSYRRIVSSGTCTTTLASNIVQITVGAATIPITNNDIAQPTPDATFCTTSGDPSIIKGSLPGTAGAFTYQWQMSTDNLSFVNILTAGANGLDYDPPPITKTTYFRRVVTGDCSAPSTSNVVAILLTPLINGNTITTPGALTSFCGAAVPGQMAGSAVPVGSFVQWQQSTDNISFTDIAGETKANYTPFTRINVTTYYRRVVDLGGCSTPLISNVLKINIYTVTPISNNVISQPVPDADFCAPNADPSIIIGNVPTVNVGTINYQWQKSTDNLSFTDITGATSLNYDPTPISTTTYYRRLATSGDCTIPFSSNVITITIAGVTNNVITTQSASFCGPALAGDITGYLLGPGYSYQWQQSADNVNFTDIPGANKVLYNPGVVKTTTYYRRVVPGGACGGPSPSNSIAISIGAGTFAKIAAVPAICEGSSVTLTASGGISYSWYPATGLSADNIATPTATPLVTTTYRLTVYNGNCTDTASVTVTVIHKPKPDAGEDKIILKGDKVQLAGKVTGSNVQYSWSPTTYLDDPTILNPTATPTESITYTLTATTAQGCGIETDKVTINVYVKVIVPNTFTPNGDGANDTWSIAAMDAYTNSVVTVYNREGLPVFKSIGYNKNWDGTYKGKLLPFGTYYYVIDLKDGNKPMSGWLAIVK